MTLNNGGPAFPYDDRGPKFHYGISMRDWFAGQALAGLLGGWPSDTDPKVKTASEWAYEFADAMLEARDK